MTPKEKAEELVEKYLPEVRGADRYDYNVDAMNIYIAKQCAKIAVENEYKEKRELIFLLRSNYVITLEKTYIYYIELLNKEEQEVKQEIEKL